MLIILQLLLKSSVIWNTQPHCARRWEDLPHFSSHTNIVCLQPYRTIPIVTLSWYLWILNLSQDTSQRL